VLYATTPEFLERLGLPSLASLPSLAPLLGVDELAEEEGVRADDVVDAGPEDEAPAGELGDMADDMVDDVAEGAPADATGPAGGAPDVDAAAEAEGAPDDDPA